MKTVEQLIATNIFIHEPEDIYHAQASHYLSSHQLIDFIRCPFLHRQKKLGLIVTKETDAYMVGKAAHVRILEGTETFQSRYSLDWPCNDEGDPLDGRTKAVKEWKAQQTQYPLNPKDVALIAQMAQGVALNDQAVELISTGIAEGVIRTTYNGHPCQIRIDWLNPEHGIVDLKTCDDLTYFEADARKYKYHNQMAFYQAVLKQVLGFWVPVYLIAIEKKEPYRCGVWRMTDDCLAAARHDNEQAMQRLVFCQTENVWPTGYEEVRLLEIF